MAGRAIGRAAPNICRRQFRGARRRRGASGIKSSRASDRALPAERGSNLVTPGVKNADVHTRLRPICPAFPSSTPRVPLPGRATAVATGVRGSRTMRGSYARAEAGLFPTRKSGPCRNVSAPEISSSRREMRERSGAGHLNLPRHPHRLPRLIPEALRDFSAELAGSFSAPRSRLAVYSSFIQSTQCEMPPNGSLGSMLI